MKELLFSYNTLFKRTSLKYLYIRMGFFLFQMTSDVIEETYILFSFNFYHFAESGVLLNFKKNK